MSVPASFTNAWAGRAWALTVRVPWVTTVALLVVTSPCVAVMAMWAAPVVLPDRSTLAPCSVMPPAARLVPLAASVWVVVTFRLPELPRLPSFRTPAPSTACPELVEGPALPLCRLPAAMLVWRPALMLPSLLKTPPTMIITSLAPRIDPLPLFTLPAWMARSVAAPRVPWVLSNCWPTLSPTPAWADWMLPWTR